MMIDFETYQRIAQRLCVRDGLNPNEEILRSSIVPRTPPDLISRWITYLNKAADEIEKMKGIEDVTIH